MAHRFPAGLVEIMGTIPWTKTNSLLKDPESCLDPAVVYGNHLFTFGSSNHRKFRDTVVIPALRVYHLNIGTLEWSRIFYTSPITLYERRIPTAVLYGDYVYLYGGQRLYENMRIPNGHIARFDLRTMRWDFPLTYNAPPEPNMHSACIIKDSMYVTGGRTDQGMNEYLCVLNLNTHNWTSIRLKDVGLPLKLQHSTCEFQGRLFLWGGCSITKRLDPEDEMPWTLTKDPRRIERGENIEHPIVENSIHNDVYVIGEEDSFKWRYKYSSFGDNHIYKYNPETNTSEKFEGPGGCCPTLRGHQMSAYKDSIIISGGIDIGPIHGDICEDCYCYSLCNAVYLYTPGTDTWRDVTPKKIIALDSLLGFHHGSTIYLSHVKRNGQTCLFYFTLDFTLEQLCAEEVAQLKLDISQLSDKLQTYINQIDPNQNYRNL